MQPNYLKLARVFRIKESSSKKYMVLLSQMVIIMVLPCVVYAALSIRFSQLTVLYRIMQDKSWEKARSKDIAGQCRAVITIQHNIGNTKT